MPVSCSKLKKEGGGNGMDVVQSSSSDFIEEMEYKCFHIKYIRLHSVDLHFINKSYDKNISDNLFS